MELTIGSGRVWMSHIVRKGKHGIFLRYTGEPHEIDSIVPEAMKGDKVYIEDQDIAIWCDNLKAARVLQDIVNILALNLNGREVIDITAPADRGSGVKGDNEKD